MSVVVVGLNHRTVPLALLERVTIDGARLPKALHDVLSHDHVSEAVVLSTCNRTEVYVAAPQTQVQPAIAWLAVLSVALMGIAANIIAQYIERYRWIAWVGLALGTLAALGVVGATLYFTFKHGEISTLAFLGFGPPLLVMAGHLAWLRWAPAASAPPAPG